MNPAEATAARFNDLINARDADGLAGLMTEDHTFVDSAGSAVRGRAECRDAWRGFFAAFPTYRNEFDTLQDRGGVVVMTGRSVCADHPGLDGPAIWTARVDGPLVSQWRVHDDTPQVREQLGLG